jgi:hypothetical protein
MVRVYFNAKEEWPLVWPVDRGDPSTEQKVRKVDICGAEGITVFERYGKLQPKAWIEYSSATLIVRDNTAFIYPSRR